MGRITVPLICLIVPVPLAPTLLLKSMRHQRYVVHARDTVASAAGRARAVSLAKQVEGVRSVKDELTIAPKK